MCLVIRLACFFTTSLMTPSLSSNTLTASILIDGSIKSRNCLKIRIYLTSFDEATYSASEVPYAVTAYTLEYQLTAPFASITTLPDPERLVSRQAPKSESLYASMLSSQPCPPYVIPYSFVWRNIACASASLFYAPAQSFYRT